MIPTVDPIVSASETNTVVLAAVDTFIVLGVTAAQRLTLGKNADTQDGLAQNILILLTAWRQKDNLTDKQQEALLNRLDNVTKLAA